jgi:hypothetical protein
MPDALTRESPLRIRAHPNLRRTSSLFELPSLAHTPIIPGGACSIR